MKPSLKSTVVAWLLAGFFGVVTTILWLLILLEGQVSGMAGMVIYAFLIGYGIGHLVIFLPVFLLFFRNRDGWIWQFRFMIPFGVLIGGISVLFKGSPLSEPSVQKAGLALALYGAMLAVSYVSASKLANKTSHHNPLPAE